MTTRRNLFQSILGVLAGGTLATKALQAKTLRKTRRMQSRVYDFVAHRKRGIEAGTDTINTWLDEGKQVIILGDFSDRTEMTRIWDRIPKREGFSHNFSIFNQHGWIFVAQPDEA